MKLPHFRTSALPHFRTSALLSIVLLFSQLAHAQADGTSIAYPMTCPMGLHPRSGEPGYPTCLSPATDLSTSIPYGTVCGFSRTDVVALTMTCMGHDPRYSCPPGFAQGSTGWRAGGTFFCYKT